jgi:hypothetical protein
MRRMPTFTHHVLSPPQRCSLYAQSHNAVDNVIVVLLQCFDSLLPANTRLRHHELDILALQAGLINLFAIILLFLSRLLVLDRLALVAAVGSRR